MRTGLWREQVLHEPAHKLPIRRARRNLRQPERLLLPAVPALKVLRKHLTVGLDLVQHLLRRPRVGVDLDNVLNPANAFGGQPLQKDR